MWLCSLLPSNLGPSTNNVWQEEKKFEEVEKEYEAVAELAKEEEVELRWVTYYSRRSTNFASHDAHGNLSINQFSSLSPPKKMHKFVEGIIFAKEVNSLQKPRM